MKIRTYSELIRLETFEERFEYLKVGGGVGKSTFGFERYLNQAFYTSKEWRNLRHQIVVRDNGLDLAVEGYDIFDRAIVHHMNPISINDLRNHVEEVLEPEYLITTTHTTHNAIHYSNASALRKLPVERRPGDTRLW